MRAIVDGLARRYQAAFNERVAITAPTGIAATHIGGVTLHSFAGHGVTQRLRDFWKMTKGKAAARWLGAEVLIIDEISMLSAEHFEQLERKARCLRGRAVPGNADKPFGGIQLILCGDFFQLRPIENRKRTGADPADIFRNRGFAFQAPAWARCGLPAASVVLTQVFRQADAAFVAVLNDVRLGRPAAAVALLESRCRRPLGEQNGVRPTDLFPKNDEADRVNRNELARLEGDVVVYTAEDCGVSKEENDYQRKVERGRPAAPPRPEVVARQLAGLLASSFFKDCQTAKRIEIKQGAQVMLLANLDVTGEEDEVGARRQLVNGSRGVVVGFRPVRGPGCEAEKLQAELARLRAGARVTHDSEAAFPQTAGLSAADAVRRLESDAALLAQLSAAQADLRLPLVRFLHGRECVVFPASFSAEVWGLGTAVRVQVPLRLAWCARAPPSQPPELARGKPPRLRRGNLPWPWPCL